MKRIAITLAIALPACSPSVPNPSSRPGLEDVITNTWDDSTAVGFDTDGDGVVDVPLDVACPGEVIDAPDAPALFLEGTWIMGGGLHAAAGLPAGLEFKIMASGDVVVYDDGAPQEQRGGSVHRHHRSYRPRPNALTRACSAAHPSPVRLSSRDGLSYMADPGSQRPI